MEHCRALTKKGTPCSRVAINDTGYCWQHQFMVVSSQPVIVAAPVSPLVTALKGLTVERPLNSFPIIPAVNSRRLLPPIINPVNTPQSPPRVTIGTGQQMPPKIASPRKTPQSPPKISSPVKNPQFFLKVSSPVRSPQPPPKISSPRKSPQPPPKISSPTKSPLSPPKISSPRKSLQSAQIRPDFDNTVSSKQSYTHIDIMKGLRAANLSIKGDYEAQKSRYLRFLRDGAVPYVTLTGKPIPWYNGIMVFENKYYTYGQQVRDGGIIGEGRYQLERQTYDPIVSLDHRMMTSVSIAPVPQIQTRSDLEMICHPMYVTDMDGTYIGDVTKIYADNQQRCYTIPYMLKKWENGLVYYDKNLGMVMPQYPKDVDGKYLHSITIVSVYHTAVSRGIDVSKYPMLGLLVQNSDFLLDISRFLRKYAGLATTYTQLHAEYPEDHGLYNRRDLLAFDLLGQITARYQIDFRGAATPKIKDVNKIVYEPTITSFFLSKGYSISYDKFFEFLGDTEYEGLKWIPNNLRKKQTSVEYDRNCDNLIRVINLMQPMLIDGYIY
jgi:hypothetical protein